MKMQFQAHSMLRITIAAGVLSAASLSSAFAAQVNEAAEARAQETWREAIAQAEVPAEGCFYASYPGRVWNRIACAVAPNIAYVPRLGSISQTVGNGADYTAVAHGPISRTVGSFPRVTGVVSEADGSANVYSLQINSDFMNTAPCNGIPNCLSWQQFIYSSSSTAAFMQYWLINYGNNCPAGWNSYAGSCYTNSAAVAVPQEAITSLKTLKLTGAARAGGKDTLIMTVGTLAYTVAGKDSVVDLASAWAASEFNIVGDGGGSEAYFNTGSSIRVKIAVADGTTTAPTCGSNDGTTGETNNLNLRSCTGTGGTKPYIEFTESN